MRNSILLTAVMTLVGGCQRSSPAELTPEQARRACMQRLQHAARIVDSFAERYGGFPAANAVNQQGDILYSWRFTVFSGMHDGLDAEFPSTARDRHPEDYKRWEIGGIYAHSIPTITTGRAVRDNRTDVVALVGPGTAFTEFAVQPGPTTGNTVAWQWPERDAILLVECDTTFHWIQPGDLDITTLDLSRSAKGLGKLRGNLPGGFAIAFVDCTVWFLDDSTPTSELGKFFTVESAKQYDREVVLRKYVINELKPPFPWPP